MKIFENTIGIDERTLIHLEFYPSKRTASFCKKQTIKTEKHIESKGKKLGIKYFWKIKDLQTDFQGWF